MLANSQQKDVNNFLRSQSSHTKYGLFRKTYPRLKVIVNDINEIWSLHLAYVDKLAKDNPGVQYLLVDVNSLSRYLRVEPWRPNKLKKQPNFSKKMIKTKQPKKFGLTNAPSLKESSKSNVLNEKSSNTILTVKKKSAFAERNIRSLKSIIYKYLEFEWTCSYIEKLQSFVQTINSQVNRVKKFAPNKVTRNHVTALISFIANSSSKLVQKPKFYVGDYVRIAKTDLPFRKGYKQILQTKFLK